MTKNESASLEPWDCKAPKPNRLPLWLGLVALLALACAVSVFMSGCTRQQQVTDSQVAAVVDAGLAIAKVAAPDNSTLAAVSPYRNLIHASIQNVSYVVFKGDSLWLIALKQTGSGFNWVSIWNANVAIIGDAPDLIRPGIVLSWQQDKIVDADDRRTAYAWPAWKR